LPTTIRHWPRCSKRCFTADISCCCSSLTWQLTPYAYCWCLQPHFCQPIQSWDILSSLRDSLWIDSERDEFVWLLNFVYFLCVSILRNFIKISHPMKPLKESMVQRKACTLMTPFGPNRTMDASTAALFLSAYHMQKSFHSQGNCILMMIFKRMIWSSKYKVRLWHYHPVAHVLFLLTYTRAKPTRI
jgi:hypothetical protein